MNWARSRARSRWSRGRRSQLQRLRCAKASLSAPWSHCGVTGCMNFLTGWSTSCCRVCATFGVSTKSFDGRGNYTLGLHDQLIFPEIDYAKVDKLKGMNVTIVTTARSDDQGRALLRHLGMPFRA